MPTSLHATQPECHRVVTEAADTLFVGIHRRGVSPISTVAAVATLNDRTAQAGILHRFSGHSLRVGVTQKLFVAVTR
ncbi:site-specific integrase [Azospirillum canadense]|uniref:hypothetical protein n=1 Tax=Azospirillum canadense TaxID=403962 RepID=UPI00222614B1|nr:hypothetical protein [Azospirillum canadense]MCW2239583.1 hypothetical protein [Azospirillum canadense]